MTTYGSSAMAEPARQGTGWPPANTYQDAMPQEVLPPPKTMVDGYISTLSSMFDDLQNSAVCGPVMDVK